MGAVNLDALEDIVTCPIHFGILEDPRVLPCGHAFCYACLKQILAHDMRACPTCKGDLKIHEDDLPRDFALVKVIELFCTQRSRAMVTDGPPSPEISEVTVLYKLLDCIEATWQGADVNQTHRWICRKRLLQLLSRMEETSDVGFEGEVSMDDEPEEEASSVDLEILRRKMVKLARYRVRHEVSWVGSAANTTSSRRSLTNAESSDTSEVMSDVSKVNLVTIRGADLFTESSDDPRSGRLLILNEFDDSIAQKGMDEEFGRRYSLQLESESFLPQVLRCVNGKIFVTGFLQLPDRPAVGILLQASQDGVVLHRSPEYPFLPDVNADPPVCGFDVDPESGEVVMVCPNQCAIYLLSSDLEEQESFMIDRPQMTPFFVVRDPESSEIWVTCPKDSRILVINSQNGHLKYLFAEEIFDCVPSHITRTSDKRVVVLDAQESRIFWLKKTDHTNIIVQKLDFSIDLKSETITSISALSDHRLLVSTQSRIFVLKPNRSFPVEQRQTISCVIL